VRFEPPAELAHFLSKGSPPVYIGFGRMPSTHAYRTASVIVEVLAATRTRAVLAKGWGSLPAEASTGDVHVVESAPHDWLFSRCSGVIHHGGAGMTHAGLRWGRPTLVCPVIGDQPFWGLMVERIRVGPSPIPLGRLNVDLLKAALRELQSKSLQDKAVALSKNIQMEGGAQTAADLIEAA
jgi:sterol 3beta-glucosyltransferase